MSALRHHPIRVTIAAIAVQVAVLVGVLTIGTGTAAAHANVVATSPGDGTSVAAAPSRVEVTFSESITARSDGLVVRDARGERVDDGASRTNGAVLSVGLRSGLRDGTYVATYRVLSADDHPVSGSFLFGIGTETLDRSLTSSSGDRGWELVGDVSRIVLLLAALLAAGGAFFLAFLHDDGDDRWTIVPFVRIGTMVAFLAMVGLVMAQAALVSGRGAGASTDTDVLRQVLSGSPGRSLAVLLVGLAAVHLSTTLTNRAVTLTLALYGGLAVTVSFALWGHPTAFPAAWLSMGVDAVHATAAAIWLGGLVGVSIVLRRDASTIRSTATIVGRFSTVALWSVLALVLAGITLAVIGSGASWTALVTTTWGRLVLAKAAVTSTIVVLAAWNRRSLVPAIVSADVGTLGSATAARRRLLRSVRIEIVAIVVILGLTGFLTAVTPARSATTATATGFRQTRTVDSGVVTMAIRPARVGRNTIEVTYTTATGQPADVGNTMTLEFSLPSEGLAPLIRQTNSTDTGRFGFEGNELSIPGTWTVTLAVRTGVFAEQRTSFEVHLDP